MKVYLFKYLGLIKDDTILSKLFFYPNIMCKDGSVVPGGECPSMDWMTDTPSLGAATRDMSWFMGFYCSLFPHVPVISNFPYPGKLSLKDPIKPLAKSKDVSPLWGVYINYPLPTEQNLGGTVTGIGDRMGGPHAFDSLTPYTVSPAMSSQICLYCNRSYNGRDQLMNHLRFHYWMVLVCPICAGFRVWTNSPDDANQEDRGHLIDKTLTEM